MCVCLLKVGSVRCQQFYTIFVVVVASVGVESKLVLGTTLSPVLLFCMYLGDVVVDPVDSVGDS